MDNNELAMIQNNLKMLKQPTGQLKTAYNHNSGLIRLLKTINTLMFHQGQAGIAKGHLILPLSAYGLYRACGKRFIMKYSIQTTKRLINLLCVAGAIKVLSWGDLPQTEKKQAKYKHIYYQCLDLREADFSRVSGMGQQKNGLLCIISTSGFNLKGAMFEDYQVMDDILHNKQANDRQFIAIWELDDREEVNDQDNWIKANPLFEIPAVNELMSENLVNDVATARQQGDLVPVLVKQFNMWCQSNSDSFISHSEWSKTIVDKPSLQGQRVVFGIDLSKSNDLTSVSWIIPQDDGSFYCDSHSWVATKYGLVSKMKQDGINYKALADANECDITDLESGVINYQAIFDFIKRMVDENNLKVEAICYDPWSFSYLLGQFEKQSWPLIETAQNNKTLSFPTKQFKEYLLNKQITHSNNHLLSIAVDNSVLIYDSTGNVRINKMKNNEKIDPLAALMNAWVYTSNEIIEGTDNEADNEFYTSDKFTF
ncbi:terminase TerL endonuclease subunit [Lactiplantibacillus plantarum]|uniref:terminase TerL endonuclease subunit n=1 Tax=Lactiplantibacillus plantarum TaxID=1590 RepID=UPI0032DE853E